jgi:hypothetical protein
MSNHQHGSRPAEARNLRLIGHSDLNGHGDGMQLLLKDHYLFVGHVLGKMGTTVLDVSNPREPRVVQQLEIPAYTHSHKVQIAGDILIVNYEKYPIRGSDNMPERAGIRILDISDPPNPREIGFFSTGGKGVHRVWYTGGKYAHMSATPDGYSDRIMLTVDMSDPANPREVSRWWMPGMWTAGGEKPTWSSDLGIGAHHPIVWQNRAYWGFWDAGIIIMDISDPANPQEVSRLGWAPEDGGHTHTALPLPARNLLVVTDEATHPDCQEVRKRVRLLDISDETQPRVISKFPEPEGDFCQHGLRYGPHNVHENRPGSFISDEIIFVTYFNAGLRVYNISDPEAPKEIAYYMPQTPAGQKAIQTNDVFVDADGLIYISDRVGGGVDILELTL